MLIELTDEGYAMLGDVDSVAIAEACRIVSNDLGERFGRNESGMTADELTEATELSRSTLNRALRQMHSEQRVAVSGRGVRADPKRYRLVSEGGEKDSDQTPRSRGWNEIDSRDAVSRERAAGCLASAEGEQCHCNHKHTHDHDQQPWKGGVDLDRGIGSGARWLPSRVDRPFGPAAAIVELKTQHARAPRRGRVEGHGVAGDPNHRWPIRLREFGPRLAHQSQPSERPTSSEGVTLGPALRRWISRWIPSVGRCGAAIQDESTAGEQSKGAREQQRSNAHGCERTPASPPNRLPKRASDSESLGSIDCPNRHPHAQAVGRSDGSYVLDSAFRKLGDA